MLDERDARLGRGAAEEPERRQLLEIDGAHVRFRHELARNAVLSSLPAHAAGAASTREVLAALLAAHADPADIVHHARGRRRRGGA